MACWLTTGVVTAGCSIEVCSTRYGTRTTIIEWTTVSKGSEGLAATLTHHQTGAVTH